MIRLRQRLGVSWSERGCDFGKWRKDRVANIASEQDGVDLRRKTNIHGGKNVSIRINRATTQGTINEELLQPSIEDIN